MDLRYAAPRSRNWLLAASCRCLSSIKPIWSESLIRTPSERLIVCFNPLLAEERARKDRTAGRDREALEKIAAATKRRKRPLRGKQNIGLRAGRILNRYKMGKHFQLRIEEDGFHYSDTKRSTSNGKRAWTESMSSRPASRRKCYPANRSWQVTKSVRRGAGLPQFGPVDLLGAADPSPLAGSRRAHILPAFACWRITWVAYAPALGSDPDRRR